MSFDESEGGQNEKELFAGHFGVISYNNSGLSYLYIGDGTKISSGRYTIEAKDKNNISANLEIKEDEIIVSSNQHTIIHLPFSHDGKIIYEVNGDRTEVIAKKAKNNLWMIEMPPVMNAVLIK